MSSPVVFLRSKMLVIRKQRLNSKVHPKATKPVLLVLHGNESSFVWVFTFCTGSFQFNDRFLVSHVTPFIRSKPYIKSFMCMNYFI